MQLIHCSWLITITRSTQHTKVDAPRLLQVIMRAHMPNQVGKTYELISYLKVYGLCPHYAWMLLFILLHFHQSQLKAFTIRHSNSVSLCIHYFAQFVRRPSQIITIFSATIWSNDSLAGDRVLHSVYAPGLAKQQQSMHHWMSSWMWFGQKNKHRDWQWQQLIPNLVLW